MPHSLPPRPRPPVHRPALVSKKRPHDRQHGPTVRLLYALRTKIVRLAKSLVGTPNRRYFAGNPRLACASFVSTVLIKVGAIPRSRFTRSASQMAAVCRAQGARPVFPHALAITPATVARVQDGDVIIFSSRSGRIRHTGIAVGGGRFVAISSSRLRVYSYDLWEFRRVYPRMQAWRMPEKLVIVRP